MKEARRRLGKEEDQKTLEEVLEEYDRMQEEKNKPKGEGESVATEMTIEATQWEGEIDESVQLVQVLGIPGVDADDLGLVWEIDSADGEKLNFKLNFTNPIKVS